MTTNSPRRAKARVSSTEAAGASNPSAPAYPRSVALARDHTHAGTFYRAGQEIIINDAPTLAFLVARGIIAKE
jgi:hypothetical protein